VKSRFERYVASLRRTVRGGGIDGLGVFSIGVGRLVHIGVVAYKRLRRIRCVVTGERGVEAYICSYSLANTQGFVVSKLNNVLKTPSDFLLTTYLCITL